MKRLARYFTRLVVETYQGFGKDRLFPAVRRILFVFSGIHLLIGSFAVIDPELYRSPAYAAVVNLAPVWFWGLCFVWSGIFMGSAAIWNNAKLARIGLLYYVFLQWMFGLSILKLSLEGEVGAIGGAFQWFTGPVVALIVLYHPITTRHVRVKVPPVARVEVLKNELGAEVTHNAST